MNTRYYFILLLLGCLWPVQGQVNFLGRPGFMTTPSAAWEEERQLGLSLGYLPNEYSIFRSAGDLNDTYFYSARVGLVSFMDVNLSFAHRPQMSEDVGLGDRQLDFRFRLLKEKKYLPSLVLGITPPGSVSPVMTQDYLVATKNFHTVLGTLRVTGGYSSPYVIVKDRNQENFFKALELARKEDLRDGEYLSGFFGSLAYMPFDFAGIVVEYNTETVNAGAFVKLWDWLHLQGYSLEGKAWAFQVSAQVPLDLLPRTLRRHEKALE